MHRREVTWDEVMRLATELCGRIARPISMVIPVARGGLVPASIIAYQLKLEIPYALTVDHGGDGMPPAITGSPGVIASLHRSDLLILDDIADTGRTFRATRNRFPNACLVALFVKPAGLDICEEYGELVDQDTWLAFPWAPNDEVNR